jgi:transposase
MCHNVWLPNGEVTDVTATDGSAAQVRRRGANGAIPTQSVAKCTSGAGGPCPALLAVAEGQSYTTAAQLVGRRTGDTVARWVTGFNRGGLAALVPGHGGGQRVRYGAVEQGRILAEVARPPDRARDGTATWSLTTLQAALRRAEDGLPGVSTYTIGRTLHAAGFGWQRSRTWCETGVVVRRRKHDGLVAVTDPDAAAKRG